MKGSIAVMLIAGTTGLVAYLSTRKRGAKVTTVTHTDKTENAEK